MKTVELLKWGKGYYVMTRVFDRAEGREWFKTKALANAKVKELKKAGYVDA
jgi:hypothetical protein